MPKRPLAGHSMFEGVPFLSPDEIRDIAAYCSEEVRRQGDGPLYVGYMINAWMSALESQYAGKEIDIDLIENWGKLISPDDNPWGFRGIHIYIEGRRGTHPDEIRWRMDRWLEMLPDMTAVEAYKEFEFIHPFADGNGRTGKVILNYLNGSLLEPIFPPADIFGYEIRNP